MYGVHRQRLPDTRSRTNCVAPGANDAELASQAAAVTVAGRSFGIDELDRHGARGEPIDSRATRSAADRGLVPAAALRSLHPPPVPRRRVQP